MSTKTIEARIDQVIQKNNKFETTIICMSIGIFLIGGTAFIYGFFIGNVFVVTPSVIITGLLYWPIKKLEKIRKENISLAVIPTLIENLPPEKAALELIKLLSKISE